MGLLLLFSLSVPYPLSAQASTSSPPLPPSVPAVALKSSRINCSWAKNGGAIIMKRDYVKGDVLVGSFSSGKYDDSTVWS